VRALVTLFSLAVIIVTTGAAQADLGLTITILNVRSYGILRGYGNASGMPVYIVPESLPMSGWYGLLRTALLPSAG
jgi:hypothetical protein